jgi:hypothetical protein
MVNTTQFRIKPLAFANGHGRFITVTLERAIFRWGMAGTCTICTRYKFVTLSVPKWLRSRPFRHI